MPNDTTQYEDVELDTVGLGLDDVIPSAFCITKDASFINQLDKRKLLPPSVLLPRLRGEPLRADIEPPAHPRGTGHSWPPESQITQESALRYPLPYAWSMLSGTNIVEGHLNSFQPGEIISAYAGQLCRSLKHSKAVLIIPNRLTSAKQEELLTFGRQNRVQLQLLWRPIAAALVWCQRYSHQLEQEPNEKNVLGSLIHLHIGLDCLDITPLEIVVHDDTRGNRWIIPARRLPMGKRLDMFGLRIIHRLAANSTINHLQQSRDCPEWTWLWADTCLSESIKTSDKNDGRWYNAYSNICGSCPEWLENTPFRNINTLKPNDVSEWECSAKALSSEMVQLGAVVTGSLARIPIKDLNLGSFWLNRLGITAERRIIENVDSPLGLSALGATIHAQRMANDQPSYLDTLPRIKMMVTKQGEPVWIDLLKEDDDYVEGGKEFFKDGIGKGIIAIPAGRKSLMIALNHEEYTTVREIESPFNIETTKIIPVSLSAAIKPAQGNARLEVVPEQGTISNHKRIYARWETMKDTGQTTEEYLNSMDRVCPPVTVRRHGKEPWRYVQMLIEQAMNSITWRSNTFEPIRIALQHRDYGEYPVSSDGTVFFYQEVLDEFISKIVEKLKTTSTEDWFYSKGWRILAHSFAKHPDIEFLLKNKIDEYGTELRGELLLAGKSVV